MTEEDNPSDVLANLALGFKGKRSLNGTPSDENM